MQCTFQHWIATKWLEIDQNSLCMKFSALNVDFSSLSPDPLGSRRPAQAGVKDSYPLKSGYFTPIISCSVKTVWKRLQINVEMLLIITTTGDKLFTGVNVDDLEWPWTPKIRLFRNFWRFLAATHIIRVNCAEMVGDGPGRPAYDILA